VPLWYCAPFCAGGILYVAPTTAGDFVPFPIVAAVFAIVFAGITWLNRWAATKIDDAATQLS
jgi:hypothetical protein